MDNIINGHRVNAILTTLNKENNILTVDISVDAFTEKENKKIKITLEEVMNFLQKKNFKVDKCIKNSSISNESENSLYGSWSFLLKKD